METVAQYLSRYIYFDDRDNYGEGKGGGDVNVKVDGDDIYLLSAGLLLRGTGYGPSPYSIVTFGLLHFYRTQVSLVRSMGLVVSNRGF